MIPYIFSFLILLNPFALFIYLLPLYKEHDLKDFFNILSGASIISYLIYTSFAIFGQKIFEILQINFESFRIFGGIVLVSFALSFILQGKKSMITIRGELGSIASEVALPFMVGAGTITLSILIGESFSAIQSSFVIAIIMILNFSVVGAIALTREHLNKTSRIVFDKNAEIILRLSGFIAGTYGVGLVITGIQNTIVF